MKYAFAHIVTASVFALLPVIGCLGTETGPETPTNSSADSAKKKPAPDAPCSKQECGIAPGMPNWICDDGSVGGPSCERDKVGVCGWVIRACPGT